MKKILDRKIRLGLLGCGKIAEKHIKAILDLKDDIEFISICDIDQSKSENISNQYNIPSYNKLDEMLKLNLDIVSICTPSGSHKEHSILCGSKGCNVITEKPMAINIFEAKEMINFFEKNKLYLFVMLQNRFNPTLQKLKEAIDKGRFGKIYLSNVNVFWNRPQSYYDLDLWRGTKKLDGGALMNQSSHYVDLMSWLLGPVNKIHSFCKILARKIEVEDTCVVNLQFQNGTLGSLNVTTLNFDKNYEGSITIIGENGTVKVAGTALNNIVDWNFKDKLAEDHNIYDLNYNIPNVYDIGHSIYYKHVIDTLRGRSKPEIDGKEGYKSLEVICASYISSETGKVIDLPLINKSI